MRRKLVLLTGLIVLIGLTTAGLQTAFAEADKKSAPIAVNKTIAAEMKHLTKTIPPPVPANKDALPGEIDILFPEFSSSAEPKSGIQAVNKAVQQRLLTMLEGKSPANAEGLVEAFAQEYQEAMKLSPEFTGGWFLKFEAALKYSDEDILALEILETVSKGGAHGESKLTNLVFSLKTGDPIPLATIVPEEKMMELNQVGEKVFRQAQQMKPADTFKDAGFDFEQDRFSLNRNFLVSKAGLVFCFNPYEIAPYAKGIIELVIPWKDLKTIAQTESPAGRFLTGAP